MADSDSIKKCTMDGCYRKHSARGLCAMHYHRWQRYRDPTFTMRVRGRPDHDDPRSVKIRFNQKWQRDEATDCWNWTGSVMRPFPNKYAYAVGEFTLNHRRARAPRVSWQLHRGTIPSGALVLHKCNNSLCVNPDHLYLGDHAQNMRDIAESESHGNLKLSRADVLVIRSSTELTQALCERYKVERSTIKGIRAGRQRRF